MLWLWIVIGVVALLVVLALVALYNRLVRLRNRVENAWAQVDVQLKRRYDLIPNLVETVKGYAAHEQTTFEDVTKARAAAPGRRRDRGAGAGGEHARRRSAGCSRSPRRTRSCGATRTSAAPGSAGRHRETIAVSRQVYNDTVLTYKNALETVPTNIVAGLFNFSPRDLLRDGGRHAGGAGRAVLLLSRLAQSSSR